MRSLVVVLGTAILLAAGATLSQDLKVPAPEGKTAVQPARSSDAKAQMAQMHAQINKMQSLHDKMIHAATPDERQKLMEEQHEAIQNGMRMISRMMGAMSGGGIVGQTGGTPDPEGPIQMMQLGIDMMGLMTQIMMDQLGLIRPPKSPTSTPAK
jgi:TolA-binding protein